MKMFQVSFEERDQVLRPLAESGNEAVGSMGDDTPMAVLSQQERSLYDYFRQKFAQVTNPPIDPLRETIVMSLETDLGGEKNVFTEGPEHADRVILTSPVLSQGKFTTLLQLDRPGFQVQDIDCTYNPQEQTCSRRLLIWCCGGAGGARGHTILVLSDRAIATERLPIHSLLATGAVHHHLIAWACDRCQYCGRDGQRPRFAPDRLPAGFWGDGGLSLPGLQRAGRPDPQW